MAAVQEVVTALRAYRSSRGLPPRAPLVMAPPPHPATGALDAVTAAPAELAAGAHHGPPRRRPLDRGRAGPGADRPRRRAQPPGGRAREGPGRDRPRRGQARQPGLRRARARPTWWRPSATRSRATPPSATRSPSASPHSAPEPPMSPEEALDWIAGREILGMRLGLERMTALLGRAGRSAARRAGPARGGHQRQVVHRAARRGRARQRGRAGGGVPVAAHHRLDRADPGRRRAGRRPGLRPGGRGGAGGRRGA